MPATQTETVSETPKTQVAEAVAPVAKATETKPIETKPAETKPVEAAIAATPAAPAPVKAKAQPAPQTRKVAATRAKIVKKARPAKAAAKVKKARSVKAAAVKVIRKPARAGAQTIIQGANVMTKQAQAGVFAADQIKNVFGDVNERAKVAMERSAKIVEELTDLTRGNVEAMVASSKVAAKGVETLSQDAAEYSRKSFEEASATLKSFAEVKSATDFFKLQSDFARSAFDAAVAESARVSEAFIKIAGDVAEPITSRYTVAAERVKTLAA